MPRPYGNYPCPRNHRNTDRNNSWSYDLGNNSRRRTENDSRRQHRDRSPLAEYSNRNRYYTRDYRSSSPEQDTGIYFYDEPKNEAPLEPKREAPLEPPNVQLSRPEQDAKTKVEMEELKSKVDASERSNKNLKEQMAFLIQDNLFLTKDNERFAEKLKEVKEEMQKVQKDNLEELNRKHLERESSFVHLKNYNVDLFKKLEESSRSAEKLAVERNSYKADLDRMTMQYQDVLKVQNAKIKEEHSAGKLHAENEELKGKLKASEEELVQTTNDLKMEISFAGNNYTSALKELETFKGDRSRMKTLDAEIEDLKKRCKVLEDESVTAKKELRNMTKKKNNFKSKNNELTKEIEEMKEKSSPVQLKALNDQISDLRQKCDKSDGDIFQMKGDVEKITKEKRHLRHRSREIEAHNSQLQETNKNLEIQNSAHETRYEQLKNDRDCTLKRNEKLQTEVDKLKAQKRQLQEKTKNLEIQTSELETRNEQLENDCVSTLETNEKLRTEVNKLKALKLQLKEEFNRKIQEVAANLVETTVVETSDSEPEMYEIHPKTGVYCTVEAWESLSKYDKANSFCKNLLVKIFARDELTTCSFKGMGSDAGLRRPALDPKRVQALTACVLKKFPTYTESEVTHTCNKKLFELRQKSQISKTTAKKRKNSDKSS